MKDGRRRGKNGGDVGDAGRTKEATGRESGSPDARK
jgi:hypothetical protein